MATQHRKFFMALSRLLESAKGQRDTASYDTAEFFSRRLRENERTLVTLTLRIEDAVPNEIDVTSDLNEQGTLTEVSRIQNVQRLLQHLP